MSEAQIYWLITLPKIAEGIGVVLIILGFVLSSFFGICHVYLRAGEEPKTSDSFKFVIKSFKSGLIILVIGTLLKTFIPSTKELVAIYGIPKVVNNEQVQAIPEKLLEFANIKLDDLVEEAKK